MYDIVIICREINKKTGEVAVYKIDLGEDCNVNGLRLRQRLNQDLKYYAVLKSNMSNQDYIFALIKKEIPSLLYTYI